MSDGLWHPFSNTLNMRLTASLILSFIFTISSGPSLAATQAQTDLKSIVEDLLAEVNSAACDGIDGDTFGGGIIPNFVRGTGGTRNLADISPALDANGNPKLRDGVPAGASLTASNILWKFNVYGGNIKGRIKAVLQGGSLTFVHSPLDRCSESYVKGRLGPIVQHEVIHRCIGNGNERGTNNEPFSCDHYLIDRMVMAEICKEIDRILEKINGEPPLSVEEFQNCSQELDGLCDSAEELDKKWNDDPDGSKKAKALTCLCPDDPEGMRDLIDALKNGIGPTPFCDCGFIIDTVPPTDAIPPEDLLSREACDSNMDGIADDPVDLGDPGFTTMPCCPTCDCMEGGL